MEFRIGGQAIELDRRFWLIVLSVVLFLIGFYLIFGNHKASLRQSQRVDVYFVEDDTLKPVVMSNSDFPPIVKGSHTLVEAVFASCGGCDQRQLIYLKKYDDASKAMLDASVASTTGLPSPKATIDAQKGLYVRSPEPGSAWQPANSDAGSEIIHHVMCPDGRPPRPCVP